MEKKIASVELSGEQQATGADVAKTTQAIKTTNRKDLAFSCYMTCLYFLMGLPQGMKIAIPLIFNSRGIPFTQQAVFSITRWSPTLRIFVAPIIDSVYIAKFGRRKSWIVGTQLFVGLLMLTGAEYVQNLFDLSAEKFYMIQFTVFFFLVSFTLQCSNVACDGLALSTLSKKNKGWLATSRSIGTNVGVVFGQNVFNLLESSKFCNSYIRSPLGLPPQTYGVASLRTFLYIYGSLFVLMGLLVAIFKYENTSLAYKRLSTLETYKTIWRIVKIKPIQLLMLFLVSFKLGFADKGIPTLKIIRNGFSKDIVSLFIYTPLVPMNVIWPLIITKYTSGLKPLKVFFMAYPVRIALSFFLAGLVYYSAHYKPADGVFSNWFILALFLALAFELMVQLTFDLSRNAFIASICDEKIGGTYIALLNTVSSIGLNFPYTLSLFLTDSFTTLGCFSTTSNTATTTTSPPSLFSNDQNRTFDFWNDPAAYYNSSAMNSTSYEVNLSNCTCYKPEAIKECQRNGGICKPIFDSYYLWMGVFATIGVLFIIVMKKRMNNLCLIPKSSFYLPEIKKKEDKQTARTDVACVITTRF